MRGGAEALMVECLFVFCVLGGVVVSCLVAEGLRVYGLGDCSPGFRKRISCCWMVLCEGE